MTATKTPPTQLSNPYSWSVWRSAALTPGSSTVVFDTVIDDSASGYSTSTGVYTVKKAGWYQVNATLSFASNAANRGVGCLVRNAGTGVCGTLKVCMYTGTYTDSNTAGKLIHCNVGDTLDVVDWGGSGFAISTGTANTFFSGFLFRAD